MTISDISISIEDDMNMIEFPIQITEEAGKNRERELLMRALVSPRELCTQVEKYPVLEQILIKI